MAGLYLSGHEQPNCGAGPRSRWPEAPVNGKEMPTPPLNSTAMIMPLRWVPLAVLLVLPSVRKAIRLPIQDMPQLSDQARQVVLNNGPKDVQVYSVVSMDESIAQSDYLGPRNG